MDILDLVQGSEEWLAVRAKHFTASEASAMMGESKYMSRNELLKLKKTGKADPVSDFQQKIFDRGHAAEALARLLMEIEIFEDLPAVTARIEIDGLELLASFDGLSDSGTIWETKLWNETLAENVRNKVLEPHYYWQLEQQMLVAGQLTALFTVTDGGDRMELMEYTSLPERRARLIAGWKQFAMDLQDYEVAVKQEIVEARPAKALPGISWKVEGTMIISNIKECLAIIVERAQEEMAAILETDQDFADKENQNKAVKIARAKIKQVLSDVKGKYVSYSDFHETASEIDSVLQKMQSSGEKQVRQEKKKRRDEILSKASMDFYEYRSERGSKILPIVFNTSWYIEPDFIKVMKGKRSIEGWQEAVDGELAMAKIEINKVTDRIASNLVVFRELTVDHGFLFSELQHIIDQSIEPFTAIVKARIATHIKEEEGRLVREREKIRREEEYKLQKEREQIRQEEERKAQAAAKLEAEEMLRKDREERRKEDSETMKQGVKAGEAKSPPVEIEETGSIQTKAQVVYVNGKTMKEELGAWGRQWSITPSDMSAIMKIVDRHLTSLHHKETA